MLPLGIRQNTLLFLYPLIRGFLAASRAKTAVTAEGYLLLMATFSIATAVGRIPRHRQSAGQHLNDVINHGFTQGITVLGVVAPP